MVVILLATCQKRQYPVGLPTVCRIDGFTVAVYGGRHRTVGAKTRFGPYTATVDLLPYLTVFTAVYGCKYGNCVKFTLLIIFNPFYKLRSITFVIYITENAWEPCEQ